MSSVCRQSGVWVFRADLTWVWVLAVQNFGPVAFQSLDLSFYVFKTYVRLPWWLSGKESVCQCRRGRFNPWVGKTPLEKEMATYSSVLAWEIPWTEEPGRLQFRSQRSQTRLANEQQQDPYQRIAVKVRIVSSDVTALQRAWCPGGGCAGGHLSLRVLAIVFLVKETCFPEHQFKPLGHHFWWRPCVSGSCHLNSVSILVLPNKSLSVRFQVIIEDVFTGGSLPFCGWTLCHGAFPPQT